MFDQEVVFQVMTHLLDYESVLSGGCVRISDKTLYSNLVSIVIIWTLSVVSLFGQFLVVFP